MPGEDGEEGDQARTRGSVHLLTKGNLGETPPNKRRHSASTGTPIMLSSHEHQLRARQDTGIRSPRLVPGIAHASYRCLFHSTACLSRPYGIAARIAWGRQQCHANANANTNAMRCHGQAGKAKRMSRGSNGLGVCRPPLLSPSLVRPRRGL